jgi:hypothetical protein
MRPRPTAPAVAPPPKCPASFRYQSNLELRSPAINHGLAIGGERPQRSLRVGGVAPPRAAIERPLSWLPTGPRHTGSGLLPAHISDTAPATCTQSSPGPNVRNAVDTATRYPMFGTKHWNRCALPTFHRAELIASMRAANPSINFGRNINMLTTCSQQLDPKGDCDGRVG